MKAVKITFITIIICLFFLPASYGAETKIGVVDLQKVYKESIGGKSAKLEIDQERNITEKKLKEKRDELEKISKKLEAETMVMSKEMRSDKERDFRIKLNDFKVIQKQYAQDFKAFELKVMNQLHKEIFDVVKKIGQSSGYKLIVEKSIILYSPDSIDITDRLIKEYDAIK